MSDEHAAVITGYVLGFPEVDRTKLALVGGKGANLGELSTLPGMRVPAGFCVTTKAYREVIAGRPDLKGLMTELARLKAEERTAISAVSATIRTTIESAPVPPEVTAAIGAAVSRLGESEAWAVRSSATAEDLPTASFAGQQDTYLNVLGIASLLQHVRMCWASLFTDRAVTYRLQNGFDHGKVQLAVVVQKMILPQAAGILFTADPVSGNRKIVSMDASFGLGEALVSGLVNADNYKVRAGQIIEKRVATKTLAIDPVKEGGTRTRAIAVDEQNRQTLTDEQVIELARIGRTIEAHFGCPQDIEWCWAEDAFHVVQSRPITTLFPVPEVQDSANHVYVSVGHQQMMTDPMKPLGLSLFQLSAAARMFHAGGRLFVDVAAPLASPATRNTIVEGLGKSDPLIKDALLTLTGRSDFVTEDQAPEPGKISRALSLAGARTKIPNDPALVVDLVQRNQASVAALAQTMRTKSGLAVFDGIVEDAGQSRKTLVDSKNLDVIMAAMDAAFWLNEKMEAWLGEKNVADVLSQSVPGNVTSEMGLALLDVADAFRPSPDAIAVLQRAEDDRFLDELETVPGGALARQALAAFLDTYGMRCVGEIDITRLRWSEKPSTLVPAILGNIKNFAPGAGKRRFEEGRQQAQRKEEELLGRLRSLPDGEAKAEETKRMIDLVRTFSGYREYPKYGIVRRYSIYKQALLAEADRLVQAGVISEREDVYFLRFEEFREVVRTQRLDGSIIRRHKEEFRQYQKLTPPRVMTSDGEIITGAYKREDLPAGAIAGLAVSSGVVEGRARVIANLEAAALEEGDILVTTFTDPSWTPLFVSIKGLVTEVGGLMTHGAVIAREYGLPAVVGVEEATRLIRDGQRIRVNGTAGYVEIL